MDGVMGYTQRDDDPANPSTVGTDGLDRPLLLMGKEGDDHHTVASWKAVWEHSSGWHRDLTLTGAAHASFTDAQSLVPQLAGRVCCRARPSRSWWVRSRRTVRWPRSGRM